MLKSLLPLLFFTLAVVIAEPDAIGSIELSPKSTSSRPSPLKPLKKDLLSDSMFPLSPMLILDSVPFKLDAPLSYSNDQWTALRSKILGDFKDRVGSEFNVEENLLKRTEFWFDIYTRYGEAHRIVHHVLYPWIIYDVVDASDVLQNGKGPLWLRRDRAEKLATARANQIRRVLRKLSRRSSYENLSELESSIFNQLAQVKGSRKSVFRIAEQNVRSQLGQKGFFERGLINSSKYIPYMEEEFKRLRLPLELTRMPFVESSFNEDARSKVGASGIWQIMPRTGAAYMIVNDHIDERNNPIKATATAGRLLKSYTRVLESWPLAITSYNHGIGNIRKAIKGAKSTDLGTIISRYYRGDFQFASSNFYTCFLAALYAEKYNELIFNTTTREPLQEIEVLKLAGRTRAKYLPKITGLSLDELIRYNLDLRAAFKSNGYLPRGFSLHLPPGVKSRMTRQLGKQDKTEDTNT